MKKFDIKKMIKEELREATTDWSKANLSDYELSVVVALYNQYSGERKKTVDDYKSINLEFARMYFDEYINDAASHPMSKKTAKKILTKLWQINEQVLGEEDTYTSDAIKDFIAKSDTSSPYKPQIKLNWGGEGPSSMTKWLSVDWEIIEQMAEILENGVESLC